MHVVFRRNEGSVNATTLLLDLRCTEPMFREFTSDDTKFAEIEFNVDFEFAGTAGPEDLTACAELSILLAANSTKRSKNT
jgi:hypothetical protein